MSGLLRPSDRPRVTLDDHDRPAVAEPLESRRLLTAYFWCGAYGGTPPATVIQEGEAAAPGITGSGGGVFYEVNYRLTGSPKRDSDYVATNTWDGSEATGSISVYMPEEGGSIHLQALLDNEVEEDETLTFELMPGQGYEIGYPPEWIADYPEYYGGDVSKQAVTITDNPVKVSISGGGAALNEADETEASFTVRRDGGDTTKELTAALNADGGEAQLGLDFTLTPQTVTFAANETVKAVAIKAKQDEIEDETNPELAVIEVEDGGTTYIAVPGKAEFTIAENDFSDTGGGGGGTPPPPPPPGPQPPPPPPPGGDTTPDDVVDIGGGFGGSDPDDPDGGNGFTRQSRQSNRLQRSRNGLRAARRLLQPRRTALPPLRPRESRAI